VRWTRSSTYESSLSSIAIKLATLLRAFAGPSHVERRIWNGGCNAGNGCSRQRSINPPIQRVPKLISLNTVHRRLRHMREANYYREQANRARRLAGGVVNAEVIKTLLQVSRDYNDIVEDLERGLIEIRHPELLPQAEDGPPAR
jgi:hypothetical protein